MASIIDYCSESFNENFAFIKLVVYAIPVYFIANLFLVGKTQPFIFWIAIAGLLFLGLLAQGINNVRMNRNEILTFNIKNLSLAIVKSIAVVLPIGLIFYFLGTLILSNIKLPNNYPHVKILIDFIIWAIMGSIVLTSFLSFAKYLKIKEGYNLKIIFESCIDVVLSLLFFIPQILIINAIFICPVWWIFSFFGISLEHWGFVAYCSILFVVNWSIIAGYFAQLSYEHIKGNNEEYNENVQINVIDDITNRMN